MKATGFKKYGFNTGYLLLEKILRIFIQVFIWGQVARYLGVNQFGFLNYILSIVFILGVFAELGLNEVLVRNLIRERQKEPQLLGTAFCLRLTSAFLAVVVLLILSPKIAPQFSGRLALSLLSLRVFAKAFAVIDLYFQSHIKSKLTVLAQLISLFLTVGFCLVFIYLRRPFIYFVGIILIEDIVMSLGLIWFYLKEYALRGWSFNKKLAVDLLKDSYPLLLTALAVATYMRIDQIMIKSILGIESVGYYSAAVRISEVLNFLPIVIATSIFPAIVHAKISSTTLYERRLMALFSFLLILGLSASFAIFLLSKPIVNLVYGVEFFPAIRVLRIHVWMMVFVFWGVARAKWAVNENLQKLIMWVSLMGCLFNIILNLFMIPRWGIAGAAIATVISQFFVSYFSNFIYPQTRKILQVQSQSINLRLFLRNARRLEGRD